MSDWKPNVQPTRHDQERVELEREVEHLKDRLRAARGGCKMLSQGVRCDCGLCKRDREIERLRGVMKAVASMPGQQWLIGQLALAEALSGKGGEHLDYVLSISRAQVAGGDGES